MEFVVPEGDRIPMGGGQNTSNTIPDPDHPHPGQDDHPETIPPPPPTQPPPRQTPDDDTPPVPGIQTPPRLCTHDDKGICDRHGVKGKLRWKVIVKTTPAGEKEKTRLYFYTCEGFRGNKKMMVQQRLYFQKTKNPKDVADDKDSREDTL